MVLRRRRFIGSVAAATAALTLGACNWSYVQPTTVDTGFGSDGLLEVPSETEHLLQASTIGADGLVLWGGTDQEVVRYDGTGQLDASWTPPTLADPILVAGLPNGTMTALSFEPDGFQVLRFGADGTRDTSISSPITLGGSWPTMGFGVSTHGRLAAVASVCSPEVGCDAVEVQTFGADGTQRWTTTVATDQHGSGCAVGRSRPTVLALDSGPVMIAQQRCGTVGGSASDVIVRRLLADGTLDGTYGNGTGYAVLPGAALRVVHSQTGHVLAQSGSAQLTRLTSEGTPDETFGTRSARTYLGSDAASVQVAPNGDGYTLSADLFDPGKPPCAPGATSVAFVDGTGTRTARLTTPEPLGPAAILRYADGSHVLTGVEQMAEPDEEFGGTRCVAPRTHRYLRMVAPAAE